MSMINRLLRVPFLWYISQNVFSSDRDKRNWYRSVVGEGAGRILDFGCANGNVFPAFQEFEYFGIDIDAKFIRDAQKKYANYPNAHFICADILAYPFGSQSFDHILFACTGHHLGDPELLAILRVMSHLLTEKGNIHFIDHIKVPGKDSILLRRILSMDQGKFNRTQGEYLCLFSALSLCLCLHRAEIRQPPRKFFPQPTFFYAQLQKK